MRHGKIAKQLRKPAKHFTTSEKLHMRRVQRKQGPSAQRRAKRREHLQTKPAETVPAAEALLEALFAPEDITTGIALPDAAIEAGMVDHGPESELHADDEASHEL